MSENMTLGGAKLVIPPPSGFQNVISNPDAQWLARPYASSLYDIMAFYIPDGMQVEKVQAGREIPRYMVLLRSSTPAFQGRKTYREFRDERSLRQELAKQGNLQMIRDAGNACVTLDIRADPPTPAVVATTSILVRERLLTLH